MEKKKKKKKERDGERGWSVGVLERDTLWINTSVQGSHLSSGQDVQGHGDHSFHGRRGHRLFFVSPSHTFVCPPDTRVKVNNDTSIHLNLRNQLHTTSHNASPLMNSVWEVREREGGRKRERGKKSVTFFSLLPSLNRFLRVQDSNMEAVVSLFYSVLVKGTWSIIKVKKGRWRERRKVEKWK